MTETEFIQRITFTCEKKKNYDETIKLLVYHRTESRHRNEKNMKAERRTVDRQTERRKDGQTDRQTDRQKDRQAGGRTDGRTDGRLTCMKVTILTHTQVTVHLYYFKIKNKLQ